jgi:23S rRNA (pseudouridine1915-N3)-methyltransferase
MKITIIAVGKTSDKPVQLLMDNYLKRLGHYVKTEWIEIPDYKNRGKVSSDELKKIEGGLILSKLKGGDVLVLLDEKGKEFSSNEFSDYFKKKMNSGIKNLVFVIGGAYGFSDEVYSKAQGKIALSKMTFPHQLIRVFILEQIYRGFTIIRGEPYHHN